MRWTSYSKQGKVAYIHLRNVRGKVPYYRETFIDEGDVDMARILTILDRNGFDGVVIPDHAPQMSCESPWQAGWRIRWVLWQGCWRCWRSSG
jgi:mannonate dehydratase